MSEKITKIMKALGASSYAFDSDGKTIVCTEADGTTKKIPKITKNDAENYEAIGTGKYFDLFYTISRAINFYKGNFMEDVCAYSDYFGDDTRLIGGWTFYKEREGKK